VCDGILERFEEAAVPLAEEFGALPVIGIGHSLGALLQVSCTSNLTISNDIDVISSASGPL
jgi:hypothetical protein